MEKENVSPTESDERYLPALALALVDHPRATLMELAKAIGVSKATLYRFCRTRDELIERLVKHAGGLYAQSLADAKLDQDSAQEALQRLIECHLKHKEIHVFLMYYWRPEFLHESHPDQTWVKGQRTLDNFFLKAQQEGKYRIDISAAAMTELFYSIMIGLIDAERRGRVPRAGIAQIVELSFTKGIST
ncbi:TetR/AcrR family transcriptional regulator [uncultured Oxalicibacterium sp.]|uniref:TetR/AcrR family transcriptional regulator n=1 Tax=uncultured Oxalicibacterium sp. TaxID=1168540 RepID=UPI0025E500A5|nr:TetR/AcrR family transcriptional regulator [uncultured Oxalicibacterium sp.]